MPSKKQKKVTRLGEGFGGLIGGAISALTGSSKPTKKPKKRVKTIRNTARAKKAAIDDIFN